MGPFYTYWLRVDSNANLLASARKSGAYNPQRPRHNRAQTHTKPAGNLKTRRIVRMPYTGLKTSEPMASTPTARRIETWPLERLTPYERNARTHSAEQVAQIAASIQEFGFTNPILVDGDNGILAGHGRLAAAKDLGMAAVPVIVLDHLTPDQRRAYILADNKLALNAGWDMELLQQEVIALSLADFDLSLLGWSAEEITGLLGGEYDGADGDGTSENEDAIDQGVALAIVLTPQEAGQWREAKEELGYSKDKTAFWKLLTDYMAEVRANA